MTPERKWLHIVLPSAHFKLVKELERYEILSFCCHEGKLHSIAMSSTFVIIAVGTGTMA